MPYRVNKKYENYVKNATIVPELVPMDINYNKTVDYKFVKRIRFCTLVQKVAQLAEDIGTAILDG